MFHDELINDEGELKQWHDIYHRLAEAVEVSLKMFIKVQKEAEVTTYVTGEDFHAVALMMLCDFADSIDGVITLVRVGSSRNCTLGLRTAFELSLGVQLILEDGNLRKKRSLAYEFYHLLEVLKWAQKRDPSCSEGHQLRKELEGDQFPDMFDVKDKTIDIKNEIQKIERLTQSIRYADVRAEIDRMKQEKKKATKNGTQVNYGVGNWYSLWNGPKDLRALSKLLKLLSIYEVLYRTWSNTAHGQGAMHRVAGKAERGMINLAPLRNPVRLEDHCLHAAYFTVGLTRTIVDALVPHMRDQFQQWYGEQMKPALTYIQNVNING